MMTPIRDFVDRNYRHFNAASLRDAARGYEAHLEGGGKMFVTLAGAMSTAELGISLAEMIRQDKVHGICCTGANLEEDVFNLVAHNSYRRIPNYRDLTPDDEADLLASHLNRVTDTCIPEEEAIRKVEGLLMASWKAAEAEGERLFPYEHLYRILLSGDLDHEFEIDPNDSWMMAAAKAQLPIFVPGWEDSTCGNIFAARRIDGSIQDGSVVKLGIDTMIELAKWYSETSADSPVGFFQIGGGIAGDFPICVVPMLQQDLERETPVWSYFCQISDAVTSYGGYSGAIPNEKITWGKLAVDTPSFVIESDATIVAPLIFGYVLKQ
ncbi:MAG: deoxyhypusine synthase family protein [Verrucomicrobiales bacterium]|nr:deoxyhypusine synthase family protein [Verrucomicrobiales bacterium]